MVLALLTGLFAHRWALRKVARIMGDATPRSLRRILLRGTERLAFPATALAVALLARVALDATQRPSAWLALLTPLLLSLASIRLIAYMLRLGLRPGPALRAWEHLVSLGVWAFVALYLLGWLKPIAAALDGIRLIPGEHPLTLLTLLKAAVSLGAMLLLTWWLGAALERRIMNAGGVSAGIRVGIAKVVKFLLITLGLLLGLSAVGIDLTAFAVFGGALGVGLGLGLQRIASNLVSGFILLFDRSIRPGDVISIGDRFGWVQELHARYIVVRDRDGVETLIPNENLVTSQVINWSYSDRKIRLKTPVSISYRDDPELALRLLEEVAREHPRILADPEPGARLLAFGDNGMHLELRAWIEDPEAGVNNIRSELNLAIWRAFKANGITIPYPQRDVHIHSAPES
ncbi:mechanosensitive ion channel family protein [Acidihalobacter prosperus]